MRIDRGKVTLESESLIHGPGAVKIVLARQRPACYNPLAVSGSPNAIPLKVAGPAHREPHGLAGVARMVREATPSPHTKRVSSSHSNERGDNHERRNPSKILSGKGNLQLWEYIYDRFHKAGDPR